jgi:predicted P-loop ATPase
MHLRSIKSKDDLMVLHRSWIMEWAEIDHIVGKQHAGEIKSFLSQSTDLFRVPYGKAAETFPRRGIIVGSTNRDSGFLVDDTGNRRFWVVPVTCTLESPIDVPNLMIERDSIWAAAMAAYRAGETSDPDNQPRSAGPRREHFIPCGVPLAGPHRRLATRAPQPRQNHHQRPLA